MVTREQRLGYWQKYAQKIKRQALSILGNECVWCGYNNPLALQVDHINQISKEERKTLRGGHALYKAIVHGKRTTEDLQLLCANCNQIKRMVNKEHK